MMPTISVIVPVYKVEKYIHRCVDSILGQTFTDFELILVDDGSPDNCGTICDEYAAKDSRVVVIHQENGGLSAARNAGIDWAFANSDSQWLTFIDSDDWVHPQMIECLYCNVCFHDVKISMCELPPTKMLKLPFPNYCNLIGERKIATEVEMQRLFYGDACGGYACGKLVAKEILQEYKFTVGRLYEDSAVTCKWFYSSNSFAEAALPLYYYFINDQGIMRSTFSMRQLDILWSKNEQEAFYKAVGYGHMQSVVVSSNILSAARCYRALIAELNNKSAAKGVRTFLRKKYYLNRKLVSFSKEERQYILQMLYPQLMNFYWFIRAQWCKLFKQ